MVRRPLPHRLPAANGVPCHDTALGDAWPSLFKTGDLARVPQAASYTGRLFITLTPTCTHLLFSAFVPETKRQTILAPQPTRRMDPATQQYVPRHNETNALAPASNKDFVITNRREQKNTPAAENIPNYIDKPAGTGARFGLEDSGLVPKYTKKATYGKAPKYLAKNKQAITARTQQSQQTQAQSHIRQISEDERVAILGGLRANWEQLHREYQGLSMFTDTIPKKTKRNTMEAQLNQLEADINRFERHGAIFVDTSA